MCCIIDEAGEANEMSGGLLTIAVAAFLSPPVGALKASAPAAGVLKAPVTRCAPPVLKAEADASTVRPSVDLAPLAVVETQLEALQRGEVAKTFDFSSSRFRRVAGPRHRFEKIVRDSPEYKPLVENERYQILSVLQVAPNRWKCRVRVHNAIGRTPFSVEYNWELTQQMDREVKFDLGQCVTHARFKYRGVIVGWDSECKQSEEWCATMKIDDLPLGRKQPFYHVLADTRDRPNAQMTYVAQENIEPIDVMLIKHPHFSEAVFSGDIDEEHGTWKPTPVLREQYPLGLEGCWLVDTVFPDRQASDEYEA